MLLLPYIHWGKDLSRRPANTCVPKFLLNATLQFNKIFTSLINGKPHFSPDLKLIGPNLGYKFFLESSALSCELIHFSQVLSFWPKLQSCAISRKTNDIWKFEKIASNLILSPILGAQFFFNFFFPITSLKVKHCSKLSSYAI